MSKSTKTPERVAPYPKIDTLFERRENFTVSTEQFRRPEFPLVDQWLVTEKLDGTNIRVSLELALDYVSEHGAGDIISDWVVRYYGRSMDAQVPTFLLDYLQRAFTLEKMQTLWRCKCDEVKLTIEEHVKDCGFQSYPIVLYGEGYGAKIQKGGGDYRRDADVSFRLFDVLVSGKFWLGRANVEDVAKQLYIKPVPLLDRSHVEGPLFKNTPWSTQTTVRLVRAGIKSVVAEEEGTPRLMEGVVAFTDPPLFNTRGQQLKFKLKTKDFVAGKRR